MQNFDDEHVRLSECYRVDTFVHQTNSDMRELNSLNNEKVWQLGYYWRQYHTGDLPATVGVMASRTLVGIHLLKQLAR